MVPNDHNWLILKGGKTSRLGSGLTIGQEAALLNAFVHFINANDLAAEPVPHPPADDWEGFELRRSHLTAEGFEFLRKQLTKWLQGIDRGRDPSDTSSMSRALTKFRSQR